MQVGLGVPVFLGQTEINHIHLIPSFSDTHEEVVGLDIPVNEVSGVDVFGSGDELVGEKQDGFEGEFTVAEVEEVFEGGATESSALCTDGKQLRGLQ